MSETRTRIKICGITNEEDARAAVDYGADALGFIRVPNTPRYVAVEVAYAIGVQAPPFVSRIAVFRDYGDARDEMPRGFDGLQYYSNGAGWHSVGRSRRRNIKAYSIRDEASLDAIDLNDSPQALLLDTYHKDKLGGSGETFNWDLAIEAKARFGLPIILAGGLTPDNVGEAIAKVRPYAVDVSSGVEAEPGRKDHAKLKAFFRAVHAADRSLL